MAPVMKFSTAGVCVVLCVTSGLAQKKDTAPSPQIESDSDAFIEVPPIAVCPDGSFSSSGCALIETAGPSYSCPHPYKMDKKSGQCVATQFAKPDVTCPKGAVQHKGKCLTSETTEFVKSCPKKMVETKGGCMEPIVDGGEDQEVEPQYTCPKGTKIDGDQCVQTKKISGTLSCSEGFEISGKKCVSRVSASLECKKGGVLEQGKDGAECVNIDTAAQTKVCPKKANFDSEGCAIVETSSPSSSCDKGYVLSGKFCVNKIIVTAAVAPPPSPHKAKPSASKETPSESKEETPFESKEEVPEGKKTDVPEERKEAGGNVSLKCKYKTDEAGNCYIEDKVKPSPVCPKDADLKGKKCVTVEVVQAEIGCPKGYEPDEGKDAPADSKVEVPAEQKDEVPAENKDEVPSENKEDAPPAAKKDTGKPAPLCIKRTSSKPTCPKGYKSDGQKCWKNVSEKPAQVCEGGIPGKKGCTTVVTIPAGVQCPKKSYMDKSGRCIKAGAGTSGGNSVAPIISCPKGYHQMADGCLKDVSTSGEFVCPKGYQLKKKKCTMENTIAPIEMCPKGFISVKGGMCSRTTYESPSFVCPEKSVGKGKKCYQAAPQQSKKGVPSPLKKLGDSAEEATRDAVEEHFDTIESQSMEASADGADAHSDAPLDMDDEL